jgi:3-oxoacid CoA-transferase subunit B
MAWTRDQMAARAAKELQDGFYVNLGIGIPTLVANYVPEASTSRCRARTACSASAPSPTRARSRCRPHQCRQADRDRTAVKQPISARADSFAMIRGGHIDLSILGAMQVAENGDLANWMIPGKMVKGMGGAMDLVAGVKRVIVAMEHVAKDGASKLLKRMHPAADRRRVVDMVISDLGVFAIDKKGDGGMTLIELADGVTVDEVKAKTKAKLSIAAGLKVA